MNDARKAWKRGYDLGRDATMEQIPVKGRSSEMKHGFIFGLLENLGFDPWQLPMSYRAPKGDTK